MIDLGAFTDEQWWKMCDVHLSLPVPLVRADLTKPFVYERRFGVMHCPMGFHQAAMSLLLAFQHDSVDAIGTAKQLGLEYSIGSADHWLEHAEGAAFRSSVSKGITVGRRSSLTIFERRVLERYGVLQYAFNDDETPGPSSRRARTSTPGG